MPRDAGAMVEGPGRASVRHRSRSVSLHDGAKDRVDGDSRVGERSRGTGGARDPRSEGPEGGGTARAGARSLFDAGPLPARGMDPQGALECHCLTMMRGARAELDPG